MTTTTKLAIALSVAFLTFLVSLCIIVFYYYGHPGAAKSLLEKLISRSTKNSLTIRTLSYSLNPLSIQAKGILIEPGEGSSGFRLEVPVVVAKMALEGSIGHRSLVIKSLKIDGFSLHVSKKSRLRQFRRTEEEPSFLVRMLQRLIDVIFFRDIRIQTVEISEGNIVVQLRDQAVRLTRLKADLSSDHRMEISCDTQVEWLSRKISFASELQVAMNDVMTLPGLEIRCMVAATKAIVQSPGAKATGVRAGAKLKYDHIRGELSVESAELAIEEIILRHAPRIQSVPIDLHAHMTARCNLRESQLNASSFHLAVADMGELKGTLHGQLSPKNTITVEVLDGQVFPQRLLPLVSEKVKQGLLPLTLSGPIGFDGEISGLKEQDRWKWECDLHARLTKNPFSYDAGKIKLRSRLAANIEAKGRFPFVGISISMKTDNTSFSGYGVHIGPGTTHVSLSGTYPTFLIDELSADIPRAKMTIGSSEVKIDGIQVRNARGRLNAKNRSFVFPGFRFTSSLLKNLLISLKFEGKHLNIGIQGERINFIGSARALNLIPPGWQLDGVDYIQVSAIADDTGDLSFVSQLDFQKLGFQNEEASSVGEKISLSVEAKGKARLNQASITAEAFMRVDAGEILHDRFYVDLKRNAFSAFGKARYDISAKSLNLSALSLGLKNIFELHAHGSLVQKGQTQHAQLSLDLPETSLKPVFQHFVLEPFQTEKPSLTSMRLGGEVTANLNLSSDDNYWLVMGRLLWRDGELSMDDKNVALQGIHLDLPLWYHNREAAGNAESLKGLLTIESLRSPFLAEQPLTADLDVQPNRFSVTSPTILAVEGGEVQIGPLLARDLVSSRPTIQTSLSLNGIDIQPFLAEIWSQPPAGSISGRLDPLVIQIDTVRSSGDLQVKLFDGELTLSHLGIAGLFTPAPLLELSAIIDDLNLGALTTGTSFGKIEGIMSGRINNLEIANGQPQSFELLLETHKTKGTEQRISVRAVDNIARIGGAHSPFMGFAKFFTSFFEQFPYRKIGVQAALKNDIFRINGTIKEAGKEYLVRRGALWGVDVINHSADNRISFKDMIKRIKRVTGGEGPLIK